MTQEEFYNSIAQPMRLTSSVIENLEHELAEYPYFEAGWMLMLKAMSDLGVTSYDTALHRGAVSISNRNALFALIRNNAKNTEKEPSVQEEVKKPAAETPIEIHRDYTSWSIGDYEYDLTSGATNTPYSIEDIAKSISADDNCNFSDWLDYMDKKPSTAGSKTKSDTLEKHDRRQNTRSRSLDLIESFLNNNNTDTIRSKEEPSKKEAIVSKSTEKQSNTDNDDILTETLAKIYIKQQQYDKAIDIFRKLGLKYPEKSSYFASRINELENK